MQRSISALFALLTFYLAFVTADLGASYPNRDYYRSNEVMSPEGRVTAFFVAVHPHQGMPETKVGLLFYYNGCRDYPVVIDGVVNDLKLRWVSGTKLRVEYPNGTEPHLSNVPYIPWCADRAVDIELVERE